MNKNAYKYNREKFILCFLKGGTLTESDGVFCSLITTFFGDKPFSYDDLAIKIQELCENKDELLNCIKEIDESWSNCIKHKIIEKIGVFKSDNKIKAE